jgi:hypothetical protein
MFNGTFSPATEGKETNSYGNQSKKCQSLQSEYGKVAQKFGTFGYSPYICRQT